MELKDFDLMELTDLERMTLDLLQEVSQLRMRRFLGGVSERTGVPIASLSLNTQTGQITDTREAPSEPPLAPD